MTVDLTVIQDYVLLLVTAWLAVAIPSVVLCAVSVTVKRILR